MNWIKLYILSFVVFTCIDLVWLGFIAKNLYREQIGFLMAEQIRWLPALLFYLLYIAGLLLFAIAPALRDASWIQALLYGGFFGLICYATYDLTNLATLKEWPIKIVFYDLLWGTFISATTSLIIFTIRNHWKIYFS